MLALYYLFLVFLRFCCCCFLKMSTELRYCNLMKHYLVIDTTNFVILDKPLNHSVAQFLYLSNEGIDLDKL